MHLHVVPSSDTWPTRNEVLLRDYLRAHPADAQRYGDLKRELVLRDEESADYTKTKTEVIQELTDRARAQRADCRQSLSGKSDFSVRARNGGGSGALPRQPGWRPAAGDGRADRRCGATARDGPIPARVST